MLFTIRSLDGIETNLLNPAVTYLSGDHTKNWSLDDSDPFSSLQEMPDYVWRHGLIVYWMLGRSPESKLSEAVYFGHFAVREDSWYGAAKQEIEMKAYGLRTQDTTPRVALNETSSQAVSGIHCLLRIGAEGELYLRDFSTNGTHINGRITDADTWLALGHGRNKVALGPVEFDFVYG